MKGTNRSALQFLGFAIVTFFVLASCRNTKVDTHNHANNGQAIIRMDRTACFGQCPTYQVTLYENGLLHYEGMRFVEKTGNYYSILKKDELSGWKQKLEAINLFEMADKYPTEYNAPVDLPSCIVSYTQNGKFKKIVDYGIGAPTSLMALQQELDSLVKSKSLHSFDK